MRVRFPIKSNGRLPHLFCFKSIPPPKQVCELFGEQNTKQNANGHFRLQSMCEILEESLYPAELSVYVMPFDMPKKKNSIQI